MRLQLLVPKTDGPPLGIRAPDSKVAPFDGHTRGQRSRWRRSVQILKIEGGHVLDLPAEMIRFNLDGFYWRRFVPCFCVMAAGRQGEFQRLEDDGDGGFTHVRPEAGLGFADNHSAGIAGRGFHNAIAISCLHDGIGVCPYVREVRIHGMELAAVGGDGPGADVVEFFVNIVLCLALCVLTSLGFEDANRFTLAFDCVVLLIDGNQVLVEEHNGGRILGVGGRWCFGGVHGPLRGGLGLVFGRGRECAHARDQGSPNHTERKTVKA